MGRPGCPLASPKGLGVRAPKQEKVHIASKWDTDLVSWSCMEFPKKVLVGGGRGQNHQKTIQHSRSKVRVRVVVKA
jgi:hypothetical protein